MARTVIGSGGTSGGSGRLLVSRRVHGQLSNVLVGMEDDNVDLGREKTEERHVGRQRDRNAQRCDLDLNWRKQMVKMGIRTRMYIAEC